VDLVHCCELAKVKIHRALVEFGEKGGLADLLEMLGDGRKRVRDGVVETVTRIGDRRALVPLVRLYDIDEHVTFSGAQFIKEAIREIARREHVTPDDKLFKELTVAERAALDRVFPKGRNGKH
jgi:HEAT repeat protein